MNTTDQPPALNPANALPATEQVDPRYVDLDEWPVRTALQALWEAQLAAVAAIGPALADLAGAVSAAAAILAGGTGRLVYVGAGTSGRIGVQDGAELTPTFDWPANRMLLLMAGGPDALTQAVENAEDGADAATALMQHHGIGPQDVVIGVAASGGTPFTVAALRAARSLGALTIGVANSPGAALIAVAAHGILADTGAEAVAGSTRLKAGTAQKVVLNLFSTALMLRLHRVYRGQMVDMQVRNEKLRRRARRIVAALADCADDVAGAALAATDGRLKPAILVASGCDAGQAGDLLRAHGGDLRAALKNRAGPVA